MTTEEMEKEIEELKKDVRLLETLVAEIAFTVYPAFYVKQIGEEKIRHMLCMPDTKGDTWQKEFKK